MGFAGECPQKASRAQHQHLSLLCCWDFDEHVLSILVCCLMRSIEKPSGLEDLFQKAQDEFRKAEGKSFSPS